MARLGESVSHSSEVFEATTTKDILSIKADVLEIKSDSKEIKKQIYDLKSILLKQEGGLNAIKSFAPIFFAVFGIIVSLIIYVGFDQRLEQERLIKEELFINSKHIEKLYRAIGSKDE